MGCNEPEQLQIDLDTYEAFRTALMGPPGRPGPLYMEWDISGFNPSIRFLSMWSKANGFVNCASWTKKLLLSLSKSGLGCGFHLMRAFGAAFNGEEVGALGRDIVEFSLKQPAREARLAAIETLEHWLEDDDKGIWLDITNDHLDREEDPGLKTRCQGLVKEHLDEEAMLRAMLEEADEDKDDVGKLGVLFRHELLEDDELQAMLMDDEPDPPELEEYLAVGRSRSNRARAQLETKALPSFLEKVVGVDTSITLGILESMQVGHLVLENATMGFLMTTVGGGGWQVRTWALNGAFNFSIEPTTEGRWLVFTRF